VSSGALFIDRSGAAAEVLGVGGGAVGRGAGHAAADGGGEGGPGLPTAARRAVEGAGAVVRMQVRARGHVAQARDKGGWRGLL